MSSQIAISLRKVSKTYAIYSNPADRLKQMLSRGSRKFYRDFLAVSEVNLDIYRGETLGIVGRNGSGKSTLLKMICGALQPTQGEVEVHGRIAALLELGAGFNPEFSGKENVFMKATLLGLKRNEIEERYDSILEFAEIGQFIEQPVKTYSSGMYARLAFAVAINADPDILIVDEILAVGDDAFKRKCYARIAKIRKNGSTILFVSHAASSIVELCDRAVLMDRGQQLMTGEPKAVIGQYQKLVFAPQDKVEEIRQEIKLLDQGISLDLTSEDKSDSSSEMEEEDTEVFNPHLKPKSTIEYLSKGARISNIRILNRKGKPVNILRSNREYIYTYDVTIEQSVSKVRCGMLIKTVSGIELGGQVTHPKGQGIVYLSEGTTLKVTFRFYTLLGQGSYFLNAGVVGWIEGKEEDYLHRIVDAAMFQVEPEPNRVTSGYVDFSGGQRGLAEISSQITAAVSLKV